MATIYRYTAVIQVSADDLADADKQARDAIAVFDGNADIGAWLEESEPETEEQD
jgi:hypothetical protein